ncbi:hypothetical protein I203_102533 [Kwoniella mangroviensis CBS 8507]|uniref:uncharacterized protein n=1 Tax=Kwoniella mangroviensis CBS 8507 TaxID=1296122 RepID=UPI00080D761B|nr:uncharacterized protein I203_03519 [Kwoniella mangroviensis CBS 8507]OCF66838.1 hypothetical protein I203_03519 [Kwoniella mangroviensis CBS 8507]
MPRRQGPSRSLFASLPLDLKQSLRSQSFDNFASKSEEVQVKAEQILDIPKSGMLDTQPQSDSDSDSEIDGDGLPIRYPDGYNVNNSQNKSTVVAQTPNIAGPSTIVNQTLGVTEAGPSTTVKSRRHVIHTPKYDPTQFVGLGQQTHKKRKKGKQPIRNPLNPFIGHEWDCTGLVKRFTDYTEVPQDLMKYYAQRRLYFPLYDHLPLLLDRTGWFSITPQPIAAHIANRCKCDLIIDAFCGVGGNSIEFAKTCERVIAIDNDLTRLKLARHNALHHGVADRIEFIHGDFINFAKSFVANSNGREETVDVIFLSPPWGGIDYLNTPSSTYPLSSILPIPGDELFKLCTTLTPNIAYYLPRNTDLNELSTLAKTIQGEDPDGRGRNREWVEVEEEWVGEKLKAVTAYFGGLVADE